MELSGSFFFCRDNDHLRTGDSAKLGRAESYELLTVSRNERWAYAQEVIIAEQEEDNGKFGKSRSDRLGNTQLFPSSSY